MIIYIYGLLTISMSPFPFVRRGSNRYFAGFGESWRKGRAVAVVVVYVKESEESRERSELFGVLVEN